MNDITKRRLPRALYLDGETIELRVMSGVDDAAVLAFAKAAPAHDLLFLARDITHPKVVRAWVRDIEAGTITTLLAWQGHEIVGCAPVNDGVTLAKTGAVPAALVSSVIVPRVVGGGLLDAITVPPIPVE